MLDLTKLWDTTYLFATNTQGLSRSDLIFMWIGVAFVVLSIIVKGVSVKQPKDSPKKVLLARLYHLFLTIGLLIALWFGLRFESIPWLSAHVVVLALFVVAALWLLAIARHYRRWYRGAQANWQDEQLK